MFIIFLLLFIVNHATFGMNKEVKTNQSVEIASPKAESEIFYTKINEFLNFENIDEMLKNIVDLTKGLNRITFNFICGHMPQQWVEVFSAQTNKPENCKAVGNTIAWVSKEEPKKCYSCKKKEITSFEFEKNIGLFDISSEDTKKLIVTSGISYMVWDTKRGQAICKGVVIPDNPIGKVLSLTALAFTNYYSFTALRNDGTIHFISQHGEKSKKDFSYRPKSQACTFNADNNNSLIWQDENLGVTKAQRFSSKEISAKNYLPEKLPQFISIALTSDNGWVAQCKTGDVYFYTLDHNSNIRLYILRKPGALLGKSDNNTMVILSENDTVSKLKNYSNNAELLNETSVLKGAIPILQKPSLKRFEHFWAPIFLLYENGTDTSWSLFKRQSKKITYKELAFKIMLTKAWEMQSSEALDTLFNHEIFNNFSKYTQQLFKTLYQISKVEVN